MMTSNMLWRGFALGLLLVIAVVKGGGAQALHEAGATEAGETTTTVAILVDPTVFQEASDSADALNVIRAVQTMIWRAPRPARRVRVIVWPVGPDRDGSPLAEGRFDFADYVAGGPGGWEAAYRNDLASLARSIRDPFMSEWRRNAGSSKLVSCLGASLYWLGRRIDEADVNHLVIVSDMVEACWDSGLNFESWGPRGVEATWDPAFDLTPYCSVTVASVRHEEYEESARYAEMESWWRGVLEGRGVAGVEYAPLDVVGEKLPWGGGGAVGC